MGAELDDTEQHEKHQKRKLKVAALQRQGDLKALLAMPEFRRFVWEFLEDCHVFSPSFTGDSKTFFREGERNVGLKLMARLDEADGTYIPNLMLEHARNKEIKNAT